MAIQLALLSFEFDSIKDLKYDPAFDFDFARGVAAPGEGIQPVVAKAFEKIRKCLSACVIGNYQFGFTQIQNHFNTLHIGISSMSTEILDGSEYVSQFTRVFTAKFYRLEPSVRYKVTIDIEMLPNSNIQEHDRASEFGIRNCDLEDLAYMLDEKFHLGDKIESLPIIKRGRVMVRNYFSSSDQRLIEYDFQRVLLHKRSKFQDIKIVHSPSLGSTLLLDNTPVISQADKFYTRSIINSDRVKYEDKEVLILGGCYGGPLYEILKRGAKFVTMVEIDRDVLEVCSEYISPWGKILMSLDGPRHKIVIKDCKEFLRDCVNDGRRFDVIINDLSDVPISERPEMMTAFEPNATQRDNPWHFMEPIINLSLECLRGKGPYITHLTGVSNKESWVAYENLLNNSPYSLTYSDYNVFIPSFNESWLFYEVFKEGMKKHGL